MLGEFPVEQARVLPLGDPARHIKEVAIGDVRYGDLLDESPEGRRLILLLAHAF